MHDGLKRGEDCGNGNYNQHSLLDHPKPTLHKFAEFVWRHAIPTMLLIHYLLTNRLLFLLDALLKFITVKFGIQAM